jgi:predicted HicB family RNase H-like nuclease
MGKEGDLTEHAGRNTQKSEEAQKQVEKAAEEDTKRLNANVPESLHQAVRMEAARRGVEMKQVMMEALTEYLPNYSPE